MTLVNIYQVFVIRSVSPLSYNLDLPYLVHTFMIEGTCLYLSKLYINFISVSVYLDLLYAWLILQGINLAICVCTIHMGVKFGKMLSFTVENIEWKLLMCVGLYLHILVKHEIKWKFPHQHFLSCSNLFSQTFCTNYFQGAGEA